VLHLSAAASSVFRLFVSPVARGAQRRGSAVARWAEAGIAY